MIKNVRNWMAHRHLLVTMVGRELKARYRGTVLGYFWSFLNPLLLLTVYSVVFGKILPGSSGRIHNQDITGINYSLFLFTGLMPWIWFSTSVLDAANVLFVQGNLVKKIRFPVEVLPMMSVAANMMHFLFGMPILMLSVVLLGKGVTLTWWALLLPVIMLIQVVFTLGFAFWVSALTAHFRDLKDLINNFLTLWFFGTPIIYAFETPQIKNNPLLVWFLSLNPLTHIVEGYQYIFFFGRLPHYRKLGVTLLVGLVLLVSGYRLFDRLRDTFCEEV